MADDLKTLVQSTEDELTHHELHDFVAGFNGCLSEVLSISMRSIVDRSMSRSNKGKLLHLLDRMKTQVSKFPEDSRE